MSGLGQLIERTLTYAANSVRVAGFGVVVKAVNAAVTLIDVQPLVSKKLPDGSYARDPVLANVPVLFPGNQTNMHKWPMAEGDLVLLIICDRDISGIKTTLVGKPSDPLEERNHNLADAVAIPICGSYQATSHDLTSSVQVNFTAPAISLNSGTQGVARTGDAISLSLSPVDIQLLATALLATGGFVAAAPPAPGSPYAVANAGQITGGSTTVTCGN